MHMVKQFEMVERAGDLSDYKWTARRLKIEKMTPSKLKLIVTDFTLGFPLPPYFSATSEPDHAAPDDQQSHG